MRVSSVDDILLDLRVTRSALPVFDAFYKICIKSDAMDDLDDLSCCMPQITSDCTLPMPTFIHRLAAHEDFASMKRVWSLQRRCAAHLPDLGEEVMPVQANRNEIVSHSFIPMFESAVSSFRH